ncbi:MAG: tryptophan synthase subunit alpha [Anaerolineae bacterium]
MNQRSESGITAIEHAFAQAKIQHRAALLTYMTLGYPERDASLAMMRALESAGADLIELGTPFSDPIADGPVIQAASFAALQAGSTPRNCLALAAQARSSGVRVPLVMMGYFNPILSYGLEAYVRASAEAGIDGLIVPDLPLEESGELGAACAARGLALVQMVAPNTSAARLALLAHSTTGFLYLVSRLGTTGASQGGNDQLSTRLAQVRAVAHTPVAVGFGISRPEQAKALSSMADGVIVGSAVVERMPQGVDTVAAFVSGLRRALVS